MDPRIHDFLDERMSPTERTAFLAVLSQDEALRRELELQEQIEHSLQRRFGMPRTDKALEVIRSQVLAQPPRVLVRKPAQGWRLLATAALLVISMGALWYSWTISRPAPIDDPYAAQPWRSFETVYYETVRDGFKPAWVCRNEREFEQTFERRMKQPLLLAKLPPGISAGGLAYSHTISPLTINVLGRVNGMPVIVFVDKLEADHGPPPPPPKGLQLFRHQIANLVLYEVTPLQQPHILPYFYVP